MAGDESVLSVCPHCHARRACRLLAGKGGVYLRCPECRRIGTVLARSTAGTLRPVTHFLTGTRTTAVRMNADDPIAGVLAIWKFAAGRCEYVNDGPDDTARADIWQTPQETLARRNGDCEDSTLLVADLLLGAGYRARVAMGRADGGEHAWCVVNADNCDLVIESTNRHPDEINLPVVQPASPYVPEILFDRDAIYVRANPAATFDGDYWSPRKWLRIPIARPAASAPSKKDAAPTAAPR
jgi:hypothetical protein